jgi:pimeloyl-ACP methyl ester carboxylesterase
VTQPSGGPVGASGPAIDVDLLTIDRFTVEVAQSGPADRASGPQPDQVLFLHGLGGDCRSWQAQLLALADQFHGAAWTMPGYGPSTSPDRFDFETLADVAAGLIDRLGWNAPTIVGHSMGGYVAQELALRHPERVGSLVLAGTTAAFGKPGSDFNQQFLASRLAPLDEGRTPSDLAPAVARGLVGPDATPEVVAAAVASMSGISAAAYRRALQALVTWNATDRLAGIGHRTLCIAGELDSTAPPKAMERLSAAISGARLIVLPDAGHLMYAEAPTAFNRAVREFLSGDAA